MPVVQSVIVMNAKGGCGKTTVATNLASYCAAGGFGTSLFDFDPQGSSTRWVKSRPETASAVHVVAAFKQPEPGTTRSWQMRLPEGTDFIIVDTPAGFSGYDFENRVAKADVILVPVLPSAIDIHSTADFVRDLLLIGKVRARGKRLGIVANRIKARTESLTKLERFLEALGIPVVARIRDTQNYVRAAEQGLGVHELIKRDAEKDKEAWAELLSWLRQGDVNQLGSAPIERVSTHLW